MAYLFPLETILVLVWDELGDGPKYGLTRCWFWVSGGDTGLPGYIPSGRAAAPQDGPAKS